MRLLSLFSGIGAFEVALNELGIDWELDHYCEIDKFACKSYNQIHGTTDSDNLHDVTNVDYSKIGEIDIVTYGFPCQDISLAGKGAGFYDDDGNLTRSGLFFNAADVIAHTKPKFAIFENVKGLTGNKFKAEFDAVISTLDEIGYNTYWQVLNAKDYGIPQNRERVFGISIRKDIDRGYTFPEKQELKLRLKDMLESVVDTKFYLSEDKIKNFIKTNKINDEPKINRVGNTKSGGQKSEIIDSHGICSCLSATDYKQPKQIVEPKVEHVGTLNGKKSQSQIVISENGLARTIDTSHGSGIQKVCVKDNYVLEPKVEQVGNIVNTGNWDNPQRGRIYSADGISPTLNCMQGGGLEPKVVEPVICASRGRNPKNPSSRKSGEPTEQRLEVNTKGLANTLTTVQKDNYVLEPINPMPDGTCRTIKSQYANTSRANFLRKSTFGATGVQDMYKIRKLTPRECWRLMGFSDKYFNMVKEVSNTQLYKQAGNSIVVNVLKAIFSELMNQYPEHFKKRG